MAIFFLQKGHLSKFWGGKYPPYPPGRAGPASTKSSSLYICTRIDFRHKLSRVNTMHDYIILNIAIFL